MKRAFGKTKSGAKGRNTCVVILRGWVVQLELHNEDKAWARYSFLVWQYYYLLLCTYGVE